MVRRENLTVLKANKNRDISPKLERPCPPKLVSMHFTSTSTCINLFSRFYFLTPMDHGPKGKFGRFEGKRKRGKILETGEATPTKIGFHAFHINLYLHEFFELILFFDPHGLKGKRPFFKVGKISETGEAMPTKIGLHAFHTIFITSYTDNFSSICYKEMKGSANEIFNIGINIYI